MTVPDQTTAELRRLLTMPLGDLEALARSQGLEPNQLVNETRMTVVGALHDAGEWMDWRADLGLIKNELHYEAEMANGTVIEVIAEVYGGEESWLEPAAPNADFLEKDIVRLRWLGF